MQIKRDVEMNSSKRNKMFTFFFFYKSIKNPEIFHWYVRESIHETFYLLCPIWRLSQCTPSKPEHKWINSVHGKTSETVAVTDDDVFTFSYWVQLLVRHYCWVYGKINQVRGINKVLYTCLFNMDIISNALRIRVIFFKIKG